MDRKFDFAARNCGPFGDQLGFDPPRVRQHRGEEERKEED
jgi:hypothetical protein